MADAPLVILGIDPGLGTTGYGLIAVRGRQVSLIEAGTLKSNDADSLPQRLASLHADFVAMLAEAKPHVMAIEELYSHTEFPLTSIIMGHARGVLLLGAAQAKVAVHGYASTKVKSALTGNGRAPKAQVGKAVANALNLAAPPSPADVSDALAVALCHVNAVFHAR